MRVAFGHLEAGGEQAMRPWLPTATGVTAVTEADIRPWDINQRDITLRPAMGAVRRIAVIPVDHAVQETAVQEAVVLQRGLPVELRIR